MFAGHPINMARMAKSKREPSDVLAETKRSNAIIEAPNFPVGVLQHGFSGREEVVHCI